ncbi:NAD(P)-dependent oxidoreductase [Roseomonas xinghualingensis]|uniref:NAD(P)-dependent oxidoreductase n=1 Tax=Roseomonas xinghualingensis TaxID=2986475 RepID=UPI0021F0CCAA|nr:NAD(P)-dependent oxidoreductase [Roseomonas sp. SXEYE001]MCV4209643.1 NAD(P)-binding domain-containing protein [Roseomonas sp. SXEYE001]
MRACFVDAGNALGDVMEKLRRPADMPVTVNRNPDITPDELPAVLAGHEIAIIDHTHLPTAIAKQIPSLKHVVFLGTGARSYMNPEELEAECGIQVHIIKGYGDTAVAEMAFALMWAAAKGIAFMDRGIRAGKWLRTDGVELTRKTVGLIGLGGIGTEMARLCNGAGMRVLAWNRTPRETPGVEFTDLDTLLAESHVVSMHLLLNDETRGFLSAERIARMRKGAIFVNTARGALTDEAALARAAESGAIGHIALDVYAEEPLPAGHFLSKVENATLAAHSAFRTPEASDNLVEAALEHCRRIAREG